MAKVTLAFSVDSDKDADIVSWWEEMGKQGVNRSAVMRAAVRAYNDTTGLTLGDILNELAAIKRMMRSGVVVHNGGTNEAGLDQEPPDPLTKEAQAAIDALAGLRS